MKLTIRLNRDASDQIERRRRHRQDQLGRHVSRAEIAVEACLRGLGGVRWA